MTQHREKRVAGTVVGNWDRRKGAENGEHDDGNARECAVMLDGELPNYADILQGVATGMSYVITQYDQGIH